MLVGGVPRDLLKVKNVLWLKKGWKNTGLTEGAAVAQEVRAFVWQQEGHWFDHRAPPS